MVRLPIVAVYTFYRVVNNSTSELFLGNTEVKSYFTPATGGIRCGKTDGL